MRLDLFVLISSLAACTGATPAALGPAPAPAEPAPPREPVAVDSGPLQVAITVDDLPGSPEAMARILDVLAKHEVPGVVGFVNGARAPQGSPGEASLREWVAAGHPLGNHTYSHNHMKEVGLEAFETDIANNEAVLERATGEAESWKLFRYPFLEQGYDADSTARIREFVRGRGYRVAEVTIDFGDWAWQPAYARCTAKPQAWNEAGIRALDESFVQWGWMFLGWNDATAKLIYGRRVPQVLLIHATNFTARRLEALLSNYERAGVEWISVEQALADEVYRQHTPPPETHGDSLFEQVIRTSDAPHAPWVVQPLVMLEALCVDGG